MIREACFQLLTGELTRRAFLTRLAGLGIGTLAATGLADAVEVLEGDDGLVDLLDATGGEITCETLKAWGVEYVFGNTGAYEAGFVDALVDYPDIHYVLGLQEGSVMAMADGYARASGRTALVNIHSITGTANALGLIVNAWADSSPVVITVGFSDSSGENLGVFTETVKVESIPELFTKQSLRSTRIENLAESLRHAFQLASMLPSGPVFLGVNADVWSGRVAETGLIPPERSGTSARLYPDESVIRQAGDVLAGASNPLLIAGAELPRWGGLAELVELSDLLGATVSGDTSSSRSSMGFPSSHPRYLGALRRAIETPEPFDVVLLAGTSRLSLARGGHPLIPTGARVIELGIREEHLARNYPADLVLYAEPEITLQKLLADIQTRSLDAAGVEARARAGAALKTSRQARLEAQLNGVWDADPIAPERVAAEVNRALSADAVVVTEGVSSDEPIWDYVEFDQPGGGRRHLISSGGSLGWGVGAGVGAKLGAPGKQVAVLVGDGSFQFAVQALWTARRFRVPLIIVIFNNRAYQANRWALAGLQGRAAETGQYIGISLDDPDIDHVGIARGYGLDGERVTRPEDLPAALARAVAAERSGEAYVLDVVVARRGGGADAEDWHEQFAPPFNV